MDPSYGHDWSAGLRRVDRTVLAEWIDFAHGCCDVADRLALTAFQTDLDVQAKADGSFVTDADQAIEQAVRARLTERFPEHGIVGEEQGTLSAATTTRWFLDPIDGTHNFMRGVPVFATLLAVESEGEVQAGMISAPALGQRWWASRGEGSWTTRDPAGTSRRLQVSSEATIGRSQLLYRAVTDMRGSRVAGGFDALLSMVWRERGYGDFWGYTLVSDGAAEGMVERDLSPWDLAAPWILVEEAGGRVSDFDGARSFARGESIASNGVLHDAFLERLWSRAADDPRSPAR